MMNTGDILRNAANKCGFDRVSFNEADIPTDPANICVLPFFGDVRATMVMSSLLLRRFREEQRASKYFVLCSWPGYAQLFPYVNEFWSIKPDSYKAMYATASGFRNTSDMLPAFHRSLNLFFEDVVSSESFETWYDGGFKDQFMKTFRHIKVFMPAIPSSVVLGNDFNREIGRRAGYKIFIQPSLFAHNWQQGKVRLSRFSQQFWESLCETILSRGYVPVLHHGPLAYNLSSVFGNRCVYLDEPNQLHVLSAMRACDMVLDVFNCQSRYAILARAPFVACDERNRFAGLKEFELDDLMGEGLIRNYIFSFSAIATEGTKAVWKSSLFDCIISKLDSLAENLDRDRLPSSGEVYQIAPYQRVRAQRIKKFGTRFIKIPHL